MPTTSFPRREGDVSGSFVLGMARALARRGHEIEVLAPEPDRDADAAWTRPCDGVSVRWVPYARPRALQRTFHGAGAPDNLARDPLAWLGAMTWPAALAIAMRAHGGRWDAIASHWGVPSGLVAAGSRGLRARRPRHAAFFHSADVHLLSRGGAPGALAARAIARGSDALVFAGEQLRERFLALAPDAAPRSHVMAMGAEPPWAIPREAARDALGCRGMTLLALGRLVPVKGIDRAIDAVCATPGASLVIAGDGPERRRLEARGGARFVGAVAGLEKARWLAAADALIVPSRVLRSGRTEGAPTVVAEALAAGLPVISSDAGGLPEIVGHERCGLVAPSSDPDALRAAVARFASDPALRARLAEGARREGRSRTWDAIAPRLDALLAPG